MSTRLPIVSSLFAAALFAAALITSTASAANTWGSLDSSRLQSASDEFTTSSNHSGFRGKITGAGDTIAAPTSSITAAYLSGVDVFFTSMMSAAPSGTELTDLSAWVSGGGICIVTCNDTNRTQTVSTFAQFGIEAYPGGHDGLAFSFGGHALVAGVNDLPFTNNSDLYTNDFTMAWLAGNNWEETIALANENVGSGMALALATNDVWLNGAAADALIFQDNVVAWASGGGTGTCGTTATSSNYGAGTAGTNGVPGLSLDAPPQLGATIGMVIGNSSGVDALTLLVIGLSQSNTPSLGGTLLVNPAINVNFLLPAAGATLPSVIPSDNVLCGVTTYVQVLQADAGASAGVSFSPGLSVTLGS